MFRIRRYFSPIFGLLLLIAATLTCGDESSTPDREDIDKTATTISSDNTSTTSSASVIDTPTATTDAISAMITRHAVTTQTPEPLFQLRVVYPSINVRSGPGTDHESIGYLYHDDLISPLDISTDGHWYLVEFDEDSTGWVAAGVVEKTLPIPVSGSELDQTEMITQLEITDVSLQGERVVIEGITELPNGSSLQVGFDLPDRPDESTYIGADIKTIVQDGAFLAEIFPPDRPEFSDGPYLVDVVFSPNGQSEAVLEVVGFNGEFLAGSLVELTQWDFNIMRSEIQVELDLSLTDYSMINPEDYSAGTPERALAEFLRAWSNHDYETMAAYTWQTWKSDYDDPALELQYRFDIKDLLGSEILDRTDESTVMVDIKFLLQYALGWQVRSEIYSARIIRESGPYEPSISGDWGVSPITILGPSN